MKLIKNLLFVLAFIVLLLPRLVLAGEGSQALVAMVGLPSVTLSTYTVILVATGLSFLRARSIHKIALHALIIAVLAVLDYCLAVSLAAHQPPLTLPGFGQFAGERLALTIFGILLAFLVFEEVLLALLHATAKKHQQRSPRETSAPASPRRH